MTLLFPSGLHDKLLTPIEGAVFKYIVIDYMALQRNTAVIIVENYSVYLVDSVPM